MVRQILQFVVSVNVLGIDHITEALLTDFLKACHCVDHDLLNELCI